MSAAATTGRATLPRSRSLPTFFDNLDSFAAAPKGVAKLRELILDLAVRGKLVEQDENDEPAAELVDAIAGEKARLVKAKEIKIPRSLPPIANAAATTEVPTGWALTQLGNLVFDFQNGLSKRRSTVGEAVPVLRLADIKSGEISSKELREIQLTDDELAQYPLVKGDVLIIRVNGSADLVGRFIPCRESKRWTYCDHFIRMRVPTDYVDQRFLCILANSRWGREHVYNNTVTTAGQKTINQTGVGTLPVLLPPLSEQRRIVAKVDGLMSLCDELESRDSERVRLRERASRSCLDRLVNSTRAEAPERKGASPRFHRSVATSHTPAASALPLSEDLASAWQRLSDHFEVLYDTPETLAHLRQSILQLAVQGKLVPQDPNDEPGAQLLQRCFAEKNALEESGDIKKQPALSPIEATEFLFEIPLSWSWVRAAEVSYPVSSGSTPAKTVFQSEPDGGVPYLKVYNIRDQKIDFEYNPQYIDKQHHATKMKRSVLVPGMVVLNIVGPPLGKTAIIPDTYPEWNCNQAIAFFRFIGDVLPGYVHVFFRAGLFLQNIALIGTAGQDNISVTKCKHIPIPLPPLAEQKRIVAKVDQLLSQCDELSARLRDRQSATQQLLKANIHHLLSSSTS